MTETTQGGPLKPAEKKTQEEGGDEDTTDDLKRVSQENCGGEVWPSRKDYLFRKTRDWQYR